MNKKIKIFLGVMMSIFALVAVLVLFAPAFSMNEHGEEWGSVFGVIFGTAQNETYPAMPLQIVAFAVLCLNFILGFVCAGLSGKGGIGAFIVNGILEIAAGVVILLVLVSFTAVNTINNPEAITLGAGPILSGIFAILGGLLGLYGAYSSNK